MTPEAARLQALTNEHSDPKYRVNGVVSNDAGFAKAFGCKAGCADGSQERLPHLVIEAA